MMDDKILKLIEEKGPEIAQTLKVATEQVYDKILWYVRVSGIIDVVTAALVAFLIIPWYKITKKVYEEVEDPFVWIISSLILVFLMLIGGLLINGLVVSVAKIFAPEYYLISQIVAKLGQ